MICCALIAALLSLPALAMRRWLSPQRKALDWRLGNGEPVEPASMTLALHSAPSLGQGVRRFVQNRARSFVYAGTGIWHVVRFERASWIHGVATVGAFATGVMLQISAQDWRWIIFAVLAVWSAEAFNTAIESLCNVLSPEPNEHVRIAKDVGAGAVLVISMGAAITGVLTFLPYVSDWSAAPEMLGAICRAAP
jgi:diacylglycerol kinase (ATP)